MIAAAAFTRLIPHLPNFTAIGAMALFGGAYFSNKKLAFAIPLIAMFLTDLILGFHSTILSVYFSFALIVVIGMTMIRKKNASNIVLASVAAAVSFYLITNFAFWMTGAFYALTPAGLAECYIAALPFFGYNIVGNLFYAGVMFGLFELAKIKFPQLAPAQA
jgi:signal transduction histidine kinase